MDDNWGKTTKALKSKCFCKTSQMIIIKTELSNSFRDDLSKF